MLNIHTTKTCGGVEESLHAFLSSTLNHISDPGEGALGKQVRYWMGPGNMYVDVPAGNRILVVQSFTMLA
jgi:hypothetical protein